MTACCCLGTTYSEGQSDRVGDSCGNNWDHYVLDSTTGILTKSP